MVGFPTVLRRGAVAGAAAGLAAALVIWLVVEPVIRRALAIEDARSMRPRGGQSAPATMPLHGHEEPLVSRTMQVIGGAATSVLVGVAFGVIFAVVFASVRHRLPGSGDFGRSVTLAAIGFAAVSLLPGLKMPANPPAVGDPTTVGRRSMLYAVVLLLGVATALAVAALDGHLAHRGLEPATRHTLDTLAVVAAVAFVFLAVPASPDAVPDDIPPTLLWDFRLASLTQLATMWATLGLTFGLVMTRAARSSDKQPAAALADA